LRGRAFGWLTACTTVGAAIGPALGGVLVEQIDWSAIFWVNLPVLALVVPLAARILPEAPRTRFQLDLAGAALLTAFLAVGVGALTTIAKSPAVAAVLGAGAVTAAVLFVAWERRSRAPLVDLGLFRHPAFTAASVGTLLSNLMMYTTLLAVPLFMDGLQGRSETAIAAVLVVYSSLMSLFSPVGGYLTDRYGHTVPVVFGAVLLLISAVVLVRLPEDVSPYALAASIAVGAVGVGLQMGVTLSAALESAPLQMSGVAGGIWATSRYIGSITGAVLLSLLLGSQPALTDFRNLFWIIAAAGVALLPVGFFLRHPGPRPGPLAEEGKPEPI
jgi:MFS family permease